MIIYVLVPTPAFVYVIPLKSFDWMVRTAAAVPPVLLIPSKGLLLLSGPLNVTRPPVALPNWLLLIVMAEVTAPELTIPVNAPVAVLIILFLMIFPDIVSVVTAEVLLMAVKAPVPAFEQAMILLLVIDKTPVAFVTAIPVTVEAPVLLCVQF